MSDLFYNIYDLFAAQIKALTKQMDVTIHYLHVLICWILGNRKAEFQGCLKFPCCNSIVQFSAITTIASKDVFYRRSWHINQTQSSHLAFVWHRRQISSPKSKMQNYGSVCSTFVALVWLLDKETVCNIIVWTESVERRRF